MTDSISYLVCRLDPITNINKTGAMLSFFNKPQKKLINKIIKLITGNEVLPVNSVQSNLAKS